MEAPIRHIINLSRHNWIKINSGLQVPTLFISFMTSASPERNKGQYHFEPISRIFHLLFQLTKLYDICNYTVIQHLVGIPNQRRELEQNEGN